MITREGVLSEQGKGAWEHGRTEGGWANLRVGRFQVGRFQVVRLQAQSTIRTGLRLLTLLGKRNRTPEPDPEPWFWVGYGTLQGA